MAVILNGNKRSLPFYGCRLVRLIGDYSIYYFIKDGVKRYAVLRGYRVFAFFDKYKSALDYVSKIPKGKGV